MRPVPNSLHDEVASRLREQIFAGTLPPGSFLDEAALCERLEISRTQLREALKVLVAEGLLLKRPGRARGYALPGGEGAPSEPPVQAVTKAEPLPPIGLRVVERLLGFNLLAWEPNVESDIAEYRLLRLREGAAKPEGVSTVPHPSLDARDTEVGAGETVTYTLVAFDSDGLESAPGDPVTVRSEGYDLSADVQPDGVHLAWNPRTEEGYRGARIFRRGRLGQRELPPVTGSDFVDTDVKPGRSYRYTVTLLRAGGNSAPRSAPIEVRIPPE